MTPSSPSDIKRAIEWVDRIIGLIYEQRYAEGDKSCADAGADGDGAGRFSSINQLQLGLDCLAHAMPGTVTSKGALPIPRPFFEFLPYPGQILSWTILGPGRKKREELWLGVRVHVAANKEIACWFSWAYSQHTGHESELTPEELKLKQQIDVATIEEADQRVLPDGDLRLQREFIALIAERLLGYCKYQLVNGPPTHGGKRIGAGARSKKPCSDADLQTLKDIVGFYGKGRLTEIAVEQAVCTLNASKDDIRRWWSTSRKRELRSGTSDAGIRRKRASKKRLTQT